MTYLARIEQLATLIHKRTELSWSGSRSLATSILNLPDDMMYNEARGVAKELTHARISLVALANYPYTKRGAAGTMHEMALKALRGDE